MIARLLAAACTAGLSLSLLTGAPASAVPYSHDDAVGDVRGLDDLVTDDSFTLSPRAGEKAADITQLRVRHGRHRLTMRLETVALTRKNHTVIGPSFMLKTSDDVRFVVYVQAATERNRTERLVLFLGRDRFRCPGMFTDFDFKGNVAVVSLPRQCIGDPRSVQIKAVMERLSVEFSRRSFDMDLALDSAMDSGRLRPISSTPPIAAGPRRAF